MGYRTRERLDLDQLVATAFVLLKSSLRLCAFA